MKVKDLKYIAAILPISRHIPINIGANRPLRRRNCGRDEAEVHGQDGTAPGAGSFTP